MDKINVSLGSETDLKDLECMLQDIECSKALTKELKEEFSSVMQKENIPQEVISHYTLEKCHIERLISRASDLVIEAKESKNADQQPLGTKPISKTQIDAINVFTDVVNSPVVQMPTFNGDILKYAPFKKKFQFLITCICVPKELWATHLENSLSSAQH
ncbi:unnamed protein product [Meganyctiphanes norvegica]|uniref:Uncharacterized protein n=1 Tax=Meganyctiphanes norvegica TaxID=48144 RepID=A0AAV2S279_MEGNR